MSAPSVSEQKQAEKAMRESEERFRNMADHAPAMIWLTDDAGECTYLNERWYEFTGRPQSEGLPRPPAAPGTAPARGEQLPALAVELGQLLAMWRRPAN